MAQSRYTAVIFEEICFYKHGQFLTFSLINTQTKIKLKTLTWNIARQMAGNGRAVCYRSIHLAFLALTHAQVFLKLHYISLSFAVVSQPGEMSEGTFEELTYFFVIFFFLKRSLLIPIADMHQLGVPCSLPL